MTIRTDQRFRQETRRANDKRFGEQRDVNVTIFLLGWLHALKAMHRTIDRQLEDGVARTSAGGAYALASLAHTLATEIAEVEQALAVLRGREDTLPDVENPEGDVT